MVETHRAFYDQSVRVEGFQYAVRCQDCTWTQVVDEDLHEAAVEALLDWHAATPEHHVDHLSGPRPGQRLAVSPYAEWFDNEGLLAVKDTRTGGYSLAYNQECLAVFRSVTDDGTLESAITATSRSLKVHRTQARSEVEHTTLSLYRKGLLRPAAPTS
ncbi:hypothetical protein QQY66_34340 [Streptomyces sp. DG2A-72]|uniref:hypothetical protein n=1 Tax=Streptomyces sp. DG2A-72 TaxID=3051386 RepID=UPI00265B7873|nr:hypothetical protein [Streptomyces sp. DG2A-72]MDO0936541.1 hypothetical protein [Streptomyces sp. DG2A-72]